MNYASVILGSARLADTDFCPFRCESPKFCVFVRPVCLGRVAWRIAGLEQAKKSIVRKLERAGLRLTLSNSHDMAALRTVSP